MGAFPLTWAVLLFFPLLLLHLLFTLGTALCLSALTSSFRDVAHLTEVGLVLFFWVTPIIYPITMVPPNYQGLMKLSPLASFTVGYQDILFLGRVPDLLVSGSILCWSLAIFFFGYLIFKWYDPAFAELV